MTDLVLTHQRDHLFEITLNRPEKRNAINHDMLYGLQAALDAAEKAPGVRAVVLRGNGPTFSSGIDVTEFLTFPQRYGDNWPQQMVKISEQLQHILTRFERSHLPVIALLHSHCLGLALELALACDFRFAITGTQLGLPETRLGIIPDVGGTTRLTRLIGPARAKQLILTGRRISAEQALDWQLIDGIAAGETDLLAQADALADEIAQAAPLAVAGAKRVIAALADIDRGLQLEAIVQVPLIQSQDFIHGVQAFLTRQPPKWQSK